MNNPLLPTWSSKMRERTVEYNIVIREGKDGLLSFRMQTRDNGKISMSESGEDMSGESLMQCITHYLVKPFCRVV